MERLSDRAIAIVNELHTERLDYQSEYLPLIDALNQLAAYEDTRLEPDEILTKSQMDRIIVNLDRLLQYRDAEREGRLLVLPCGPGAELERDGKTFKADHWNVNLSAFREEPTNRSGLQVAMFTVEEAERALATVNNVGHKGGTQ